jgi:Ca2+-binding EF-hand superfamily protein
MTHLEKGNFLLWLLFNLNVRFHLTRWDANSDGFLDLNDLKRMMESLGAPQTHLGLKQMIKEGGNQEKEGAISFKEVRFKIFFLFF